MADERTWLSGWVRQFRLAATKASMDSRTVSVTVCFGRKPRTVRAFEVGVPHPSVGRWWAILSIEQQYD